MDKPPQCDSFGALFGAELDAIVSSRDDASSTAFKCEKNGETGEPFITATPVDLAGLALSGGGIRSATFNLGLLQGLGELGLLGKFDYVSTVSGGGYLGGFWSACRVRGLKPFPGPDDPTTPPEEPPVRHLREFSRFLAPRWGLFEVETWQVFAALFTAILPTLLLGVSVIALAIWFGMAVTSLGVGGNLSPVALFCFISFDIPAVALIFLLTLIVLLGYERLTFKQDYEGGDYPIGSFLLATAIGLIVPLVVMTLFDDGKWKYFDLFPGVPALGASRAPLFAAILGWLAAMVLLIVLRSTISRWIRMPRDGFFRAAFDRTIARLLALAVFEIAILLFFFAALMLWMKYADLVAYVSGIFGAGAGGAYAMLQRLLARQPNKARSGRSIFASRYALPLLATAAVIAIALAVATGILAAINRSPIAAFVTLFAPLLTLLLAVFLFNPNEMGLHSFYRSRLARAYLGAAKEKTASKNRQSTERRGDDIRLDVLSKRRPLHLICCTANDMGGEHITNLFRGARSATFSSFGFALADRVQYWKNRFDIPTLATAITASGAAANSNMGSLSMELGSAAAFLMTIFNVRLGYWYRFTRSRALLPGLDLLDEMFGLTRSGPDAQSVHLSDGGHFEDLALYELLRRRCKYIIASDCGADRDVAFDDVGNALRRAREDFGVEVDIDLSVLRPNEKNYSRQHLAVGEINYPDGDHGTLLLFKPTLVGDEPGDVLQYKARNEAFPHESTGDQFYDEKQWESYRRLGLHAAHVAFRTVETDASVQSVFGETRWNWLSIPADLQQQMLERAGELNEIEEKVRQTADPDLLRDLYPESGPAPMPAPSMKPERILLFTQVMQLMENVYVSCALERYWNHPLNLGWMNYFGRWATTASFREWWPLLAPMYNPRMVRFYAKRFNLPSARRAGGGVKTGAQGVAFEIWKTMQCKAPAGTQPIVYELPLESGNTVAAALAFVTITGNEWSWNSEDFFVPPSLWASGIGRAFLAELRKQNKHLRVTINVDPRQRKETADLMQMYREAGFVLLFDADPNVIVMTCQPS